MNRRRFLRTAGTAAAAASIAGCTGGSQGDGSETTDAESPTESATDESATESEESDEEFPVTVTQGSIAWTLDPHNHRTTSTTNVLLHAYEGLLARDAEGAVVEELATEYERVEEGRVRFTIREGVTFHNGDDLTPEDVAYSINRIVDDEVGIASSQSGQLTGVEGAEVVEGERAVEVRSEGVNPIVFSLFATYCDVVQRSWVEARSKEEVAADINGTGPFELAAYEENVSVEFERYDDYWGERPAVSSVAFETAAESSTRVNQLLNGETDVVDNVPPQEVPRIEESSARVSAVPSTRVVFNAMRTNTEPFTSREFRQAMNYAIDLGSIVENVLSGFGDPTSQPTLERFTGHAPDVEPYPHDPAQAEQLVEESGFAGAEIALHTPVGRYLKDVEIAQAVADQIDRLENVSCSVEQRDFGALGSSISDGDKTTGPAFYLLGWGNPTFDASQTLVPHLTSDGALSSYENDEIDGLVEQAGAEADEEARERQLQEANRLLHDDAPWIFLHRQYSVYGASDRIDWEPRRDEKIDVSAMTPK